MKKPPLSQGRLTFLIAGLFIIFAVDHYLLSGNRPYIDDMRQIVAEEQMQESMATKTGQAVASEIPSEEPVKLALVEPSVTMQAKGLTIPDYEPDKMLWQENAVSVDLQGDEKLVTIIIDDLGVSRRGTRDIIGLPGPLTLAFLPYAEKVGNFVQDGRAAGHEIMIHMPMEPMGDNHDLGSIYLDTEQNRGAFEKMLHRGLSAFDGYVGINNHMGSRLTQDQKAMNMLMPFLYQKGLLFVDSRTIASSVAAETAANYGVPYAARDVFLDHDTTLESVKKQLSQVERIALETGRVIAIGHPKANTITALKEWLPTLEDKGLTLVPVSAIVQVKKPSAAASAYTQQLAPPPQ